MKFNRLLLFLTFFVLGIVSVQAQTRIIKGKVLSAKDSSVIPNAAIIYGTNKGTSADDQGNFSLDLPNAVKSIQVSSVNFENKTVTVDNNDIVVYLKPFDQNLDAVIVIGYGTAKKKDVSGAITTLTSKDFQKGTVTSFDQMIQGKAAGITVTPAGGHPGQPNTIRIRGLSTLNGSQDPLVVVDGVPFGGYVNPNDVESVTILKDASAAAIYGSQASGGVILITTKSGKAGQLKMNFNTLVSVGSVSRYVPVLKGDQYRDFMTDHVNFFAADTSMLGTANTNWQKQIYHSAVTSNSNYSISGAIAKILPFRLSMGYLDQNGLLKTDNLKRTTTSLRLTPTFLNNHLKIELNLNGSFSKNHNANQDAIGAAIAFDPTHPVYDPTNTLFGGYYQWMRKDGTPNPLAPLNPVALLNQKHDESTYNRGFGNINVDYSLHFLPELHVIANLGFDIDRTKGTTLQDSTSRAAYQILGNSIFKGADNQYGNKNRRLFAQYQLNYNKTFTEIKSNINAMAMYYYQDTKNTTNNYPSYSYLHQLIPNSTPQYNFGIDQRTMISYLGRLIYTYNNKYTLTASFRKDGSSVLAPEHRWVSYGSLSLAWNLKEESFLVNSDVVSALKLRASYGTTGNQGGINNYAYYPGYYLSNMQSQYQFGSQYYQMFTPSVYNTSLTWEKTKSPNIGIDFGFLKNRISGSLDAYQKTSDQLLVGPAPIPVGTNYSNQLPIQNLGSMKSKGIELNLNFVPVRTADVEWSFNVNAALNSSKITRLIQSSDTLSGYTGIDYGSISGGTGQYIQKELVGLWPNTFFVAHQVYGSNGRPIEGAYVDVNKDGTINQSDYYYYHSPYPKWTLGFSTNLTYKQWTFSTVLRANIGNYVYNNVASNLGYAANMAINQKLQNASADILNTGFIQNQQHSDYYVQNASFLKMDNLGIAYNFGRLGNSNRFNLTLNANVQNVFTVTKYKGINPEIYSGIDNNFYPIPRVYTFGVNLYF